MSTREQKWPRNQWTPRPPQQQRHHNNHNLPSQPKNAPTQPHNPAKPKQKTSPSPHHPGPTSTSNTINLPRTPPPVSTPSPPISKSLPRCISSSACTAPPCPLTCSNCKATKSGFESLRQIVRALWLLLEAGWAGRERGGGFWGGVIGVRPRRDERAGGGCLGINREDDFSARLGFCFHFNDFAREVFFGGEKLLPTPCLLVRGGLSWPLV